MANKKPKKGPRQKALPGMSDRKLKDLHDAALAYAEARDERMTLSVAEVDAKKLLLVLMKKHKKEHYEYEGVVIDVVHEKENVKVRIKSAEEGQEEQVAEDAREGPSVVSGKDAAAGDSE
jgi:hypothetical protein